MADLYVKSSLTDEQIEKNFAGVSFFDGVMQGLNDALEYERTGDTQKAVSRKTSLPDIDIVAERNSLNMTQKAFASVLGVSVRTVEAWESGRCSPSPTARKLMYLISCDHSIVARLQQV